ncbi:ERG2 and sigma1 receptor-like protein [Calocera viscosa TUFC12733]|uniref:C-8 sterol isomerase n=1 Tax=Calocera viscosa (strain TUFC12733) TaxID=1330018 RepID=A0A167M684_CALVF|nr:ERG2 and sigma1 receptor-like protein [Calocera viscosa TUFC12733]
MSDKTPKVPKSAATPASRLSYRGIFRTFLLLTSIYFFWRFLDTHVEKFYIFQPAPLHALVREALDLYPGQSAGSLEKVVDHIVTSLAETHGTRHINVDQKEWFFNNAGGAMGAMYVIHASVTEYLIVSLSSVHPVILCPFVRGKRSPRPRSLAPPLARKATRADTARTTISTFSMANNGRSHRVHWRRRCAPCFVLLFLPVSLTRQQVYPTGSVHHLKRGTIKQYKMHEGCFALEYARGWIPFMLPFGLADLLTSTLDLPTMWDTVRITGREMIRNLAVGKL